ncbi:ABC transporter substrate-binding protein [Ornithinimicrobium pratense]|uniref:ABC transporter substrate-binding protein n=1 Tax=Ornithinimicrobium pratense TaxID=2593973 RepID=A0A5J6V8M0_9MICO|nr:ABC transporter substrate-binding protein [Ornithinimicrobium pratense]QFG69496.1 ABC transporter substrate-binding protein [Ornithinimicrobium pratense]
MTFKRAIATGAVLTLSLAACAGGGTTDVGEGGAGDNGSATAGGGGGGDFSIAWNAQPPTLDPIVTTATSARDISRNFFEPLLTTDADGAVQPVLAESFEMSDDATELTIALREGLTFHNGDPVTAEDAVASLKRWAESTGVGQLYFHEQATIEATDELTITITLDSPTGIAPQLLAEQGQLPMIMPASIAEEAGLDSVEEYIGTGPYKLDEWRTDQFVRLERFEDYQSPEGETAGTAGAKEPSFDTITFNIVTDASTRMSGLQSGEYDAANALPLDNAEMLERDDNIQLVSGPQGFNGAVFNKRAGLMSDVNMRKAVLAAIDPEAIQQAAFVSDEYYNLNPALMSEDSPWYSDAGQELYHNEDQAVVDELLEEAGYDGETIRILTSREYADHYNNAVPLQQQLEDAGMSAELVVTDWATVLQDRSNENAYEIFITGFAPVTVPVVYVFLSPSWPGWTDSDEISAATEAFGNAADEAEAQEAAADLQQAFYDYLPMVKFGDKWTATGLRSDISGYEFVPLSGDIFYNARRDG